MNNPQLRDKVAAASTHQVLEWVLTATPGQLREAIILFMQIGRKRLLERPQLPPLQGRNLAELRNFIHEFLQETDGGTRLVAVVVHMCLC